MNSERKQVSMRLDKNLWLDVKKISLETGNTASMIVEGLLKVFTNNYRVSHGTQSHKQKKVSGMAGKDG